MKPAEQDHQTAPVAILRDSVAQCTDKNMLYSWLSFQLLVQKTAFNSHVIAEWELKLINIPWVTWLWLAAHCSFKQAFILTQVTDLIHHLVAKAKSQTLFILNA